jgi:hypothetical protein
MLGLDRSATNGGQWKRTFPFQLTVKDLAWMSPGYHPAGSRTEGSGL